MSSLIRVSRPILALAPLALLLACGGASHAPTAQAPAPAPPAPTPRAAPEPFWASDSPERPHRAKALNWEAPSGPTLRLAASELDALALGTGRAEAPAAAGPEATAVAPLRIVTGLRSFTYHQENATLLQPSNLTLTTIQALVPNGAGGFSTLPGVGHDDGTFSITNVPVGSYWLKFGLTYLWTAADHVEWVTDGYGRPDGVYPANPSSLVMDAGNLSEWATTDELIFHVPNQGWSLPVPPGTPGVSNAPIPGALALASYTYAFQELGMGLLDATKGDQAYLNQLTTRSVGGEPYRALGRTWNMPALTMVDGAATAAAGAFLTLPQTSTLRLNWRRSSLAAMTPQVNPAATVTGTEFGLWASPTGLGVGIPFNAFQLFTYDSGAPSAATDLDLGDLAYGNPYPTTWSLVAETYFLWTVNYLAPGAATPIALSRSAYTATATLPTAVAPLGPLVSPVTNPRINGKDLFQNQVAVGTSPTLAWDLPTLGSPTGYIVRVMELKNDAGASRLQTRATLRTATRSLTVPPGIMLPGSTYVITVSAVRFPGVNFSQYPFQTAFPYASAPVMSAIVAP